MRQYAKNALRAFARFEKLETGLTKNHLQEATLAIIGCKLLDPLQKEAIQKLFKIMDESGDGIITHKELIVGFKKVLGEEISDDEAKSIFKKVDLDDNGSLDFKDFLISSVDFADKDYFMAYMKNAYLQFFDNEFESVDT